MAPVDGQLKVQADVACAKIEFAHQVEVALCEADSPLSGIGPRSLNGPNGALL